MRVERSTPGLNAPFRIGDRLITPAANEINDVRVESKAMDVLIALAEAAPAVVSSATLLERIWPNVVVVDNVVYQAIAQLRKALGDEAHSPRYIATIPRRGYRVIAEIQTDSSSLPKFRDGAPDSETDDQALPRSDKNSICVLPFTNISGDPEQEYFADGISEDIITGLSKVSALLVIARTTASTFKGKSVDVSHVARQLNVSHVLEGSVRKAGGRVRITAQLVDGATGGHVWAERYDRDVTDIFALQDEISEAIVAALELSLLPAEKQRIERRGTSNLVAYDLYLRGTRLVLSPQQELDAIDLLELATRLAPDYADAWGALALGRAGRRMLRPYFERKDIAAVATAEAERALALDYRNVAAVMAQYLLLPEFGRFADAEALVKRMAENAPHDAMSLYYRSLFLESVGRIREAIEIAQRAYDLDPLNIHTANFRGQTLYYGGRYAEARSSLENTLARWPDCHATAANLVTVCAHMQDWAAVDALLAPERLARFPLREFERDTFSYASIMRKRSEETRRKPIAAARRRLKETGSAELVQLQFAAHLGFLDEAHTIAAEARVGPTGTTQDRMGYDANRTHRLFINMFPEFRRDRRFVQLCARLGLVDYWLMTQKWPDCIDEVAPYYDFKAECERVAAGPPLPPANETASPVPAV